MMALASQSSKSSVDSLKLPPGFRFHPTDEELLIHYLKRKAAACPLPVPIVGELDLYKFNPWDLPAMAARLSEQDQMYFFSPRERKYPNGNRPNRAAGCGYWKATGTDKPIFNSARTLKLGVKKALVFYKGRPPKGTKTNWIMHEYRLLNANESAQSQAKKSLKLDDWVLCRVYTRIGQSSMTTSSEILKEVKEDKGITNQGLPSPLAMNRVGNPYKNVDQTLEGLTRMGGAPLFDHYPRSNTLYMGQIINEENPTSSISLSDAMISLDSDCSWNINDNSMSARSEKPSALSYDPDHVHHSASMLDRKNTFETKYYCHAAFLSSINTRLDSILSHKFNN